MSTKTIKNSEKLASEAAKALGRIGGRAVVKKFGKAHMKRISKLGVKARSKNKSKKTK